MKAPRILFISVDVYFGKKMNFFWCSYTVTQDVLSEMVIVMNTATRVQILHLAVSISHSVNNLEMYMYVTIIASAIDI